ncbi:MAG: TetR/AcrR family transcriptional regulator [Rhizobium sp.]|nr:TetR/AcrR family transcriptional regulator [Rhizobium sp.]
MQKVPCQRSRTDDVAQRAEVNIATFYKYFSNREDFLGYLAIEFYSVPRPRDQRRYRTLFDRRAHGCGDSRPDNDNVRRLGA